MKLAVVTGGSRGLGAAVAKRLINDGFRVHIWSRSTGVDVVDRASVIAAAREVGDVDVLVNCAGSLVDCWRVNLMGTVHCCQLTHTKQIINIAGGGVGGPKMMTSNYPYLASKAAVIVLTEALSEELGKIGVSINCVSPGPIYSDMNPLGGSPERACNLISWLSSEECNVTGRLFGAQHWKPGDKGGVLRWTPCE